VKLLCEVTEIEKCGIIIAADLVSGMIISMLQLTSHHCQLQYDYILFAYMT